MPPVVGAGQVSIGAAGAVGKGADVVRDRAAKLVDPRSDQLEVGAVFQARVLADLLVVLVAGQVHAQDGVVVVGGELGPRGVDELLDQRIDLDTAGCNGLNPHTLRDVAMRDAAASMRLALGWLRGHTLSSSFTAMANHQEQVSV